jgi:metal transporter CNNM
MNTIRHTSPRLAYGLFSLASHSVARAFSGTQLHRRGGNGNFEGRCVKECIAYAILIPILVLLSGLFAGLTLGYMSLDQTQLNVLSVSGTPYGCVIYSFSHIFSSGAASEQKKYARQIQPIRKNGHLLLVTLLLANMIVNETLPIIADPVLGGVQSVVVSTILIVM